MYDPFFTGCLRPSDFNQSVCLGNSSDMDVGGPDISNGNNFFVCFGAIFSKCYVSITMKMPHGDIPVHVFISHLHAQLFNSKKIKE